jgi:hypothetical protein
LPLHITPACRLVVEQHESGSVGFDFDSRVGTGDRANTAPDTAGTVKHFSVKIPFDTDLFGHPKDLLRAGFYTQLTAFTMVFIYENSGHVLILYT